MFEQKIIDVGYDVPSIARDLDWIAVMTYDYHGHWDKKTGHVAPFYSHPDDDFTYFNAVSFFIFSHAETYFL
jgi:chitinase